MCLLKISSSKQQQQQQQQQWRRRLPGTWVRPVKAEMRRRPTRAPPCCTTDAETVGLFTLRTMPPIWTPSTDEANVSGASRILENPKSCKTTAKEYCSGPAGMWRRLTPAFRCCLCREAPPSLLRLQIAINSFEEKCGLPKRDQARPQRLKGAGVGPEEAHFHPASLTLCGSDREPTAGGAT